METQVPHRIPEIFCDSTSLEVRRQGTDHYHSVFELYFLEEGICNYLIGGQLFRVEPGDLVLIPRGIIHSTSYQGHHSRILIQCDDCYFDGVEFPKDYVYRSSDPSGLHHLVRQIAQEFFSHAPYTRPLIRSYLTQLLVLIHRNRNIYRNTHQPNGFIQQVLDYMQQSYRLDLTLGSVAARYGVSREHLSRQFKKEAGLGFCEYLTLLRMQQAEKLLQEDSVTIAETARACGFNDSNYFCTRFKAFRGCSPLRFQQSFRQKQFP